MCMSLFLFKCVVHAYLYTRAQTNSGFYYSNILYSQLTNTRIFFSPLVYGRDINPVVQDVSVIQST